MKTIALILSVALVFTGTCTTAHSYAARQSDKKDDRFYTQLYDMSTKAKTVLTAVREELLKNPRSDFPQQQELLDEIDEILRETDKMGIPADANPELRREIAALTNTTQSYYKYLRSFLEERDNAELDASNIVVLFWRLVVLYKRTSDYSDAVSLHLEKIDNLL